MSEVTEVLVLLSRSLRLHFFSVPEVVLFLLFLILIIFDSLRMQHIPPHCSSLPELFVQDFSAVFLFLLTADGQMKPRRELNSKSSRSEERVKIPTFKHVCTIKCHLDSIVKQLCKLQPPTV